MPRRQALRVSSTVARTRAAVRAPNTTRATRLDSPSPASCLRTTSFTEMRSRPVPALWGTGPVAGTTAAEVGPMGVPTVVAGSGTGRTSSQVLPP